MSEQQEQKTSAADNAVRTGLICGVLAYAIWGMLPLFLKQLHAADPSEIVGHRIIWSVPFAAIILTMRKQWRDTLSALATPKTVALLAFTATVIAANWLIYVWAVANDRVLQASLGYYINPLMFVAAGVVVLKEKLTRPQIAAVALASLGVIVLTFGAGVFPWVSIVLAVSFTSYGYARKMINVGATPGLFIETLLLAPFALVFLFWFDKTHGSDFGQGDLKLDALLVMAGPITVAPLVFFAIAARRLKFSTLGFLQYIGPTGQFLLGLYYGEPFTPFHAVCFGLIWSALVIVSLEAVHRSQRPKPAALDGYKPSSS
ncbi:MAG: EamA family transporter RarD [Parvularculaceae bacterium]